ncbi:hypothetical protein C1701_22530 [Actinoalloteichus sp. AHMU CJ021]|nr:hypothetical protein C1701_22530 [Actinoalloteichus sp. AHMU CJ021]
MRVLLPAGSLLRPAADRGGLRLPGPSTGGVPGLRWRGLLRPAARGRTLLRPAAARRARVRLLAVGPRRPAVGSGLLWRDGHLLFSSGRRLFSAIGDSVRVAAHNAT